MNRAILRAALFLAVLAIGATQTSVAMDLQLKGKTALVTGSTAGIGYATAEALLKEGADVIINARSQKSVDKAVASLKASTGRTPKSFVGDMSKAADTTRLAQTFPNVDILVNNVGTFMAKEFAKTTDEDWETIFQVNVMSGVRLARAYLPRMKQQNWGRIIFISSESALQIPVESIHYGMTKAAQIAVARGLAEDCAKTGVTVNSILPGPTLDPQAPRAQDMVKRAGKPLAEIEQDFINARRPTSLIKRFARPEEVASLIAYVASPLSSATTGAALRVDGGVVKSAF
ncbi:MAG TPA: SDR family oxidoreductase [Steroidobacteraceae bacterium]|nr:SDR family oxidoreductase [Steroidobacteraceae bacterium]